MSTPESAEGSERLLRIVTRLAEQTEAGQIDWEPGAPADSWAVSIGLSRFRIRTDGTGEPPYFLDVMGPISTSVVTGASDQWDEELARLYRVGRGSALKNTADPFRQVEEQLGL